MTSLITPSSHRKITKNGPPVPTPYAMQRAKDDQKEDRGVKSPFGVRRFGGLHTLLPRDQHRQLIQQHVEHTTRSVNNVDATSPAITASTIGARCSAPSPIAKASGNMPKIIAKVVTMIGRS